MESLQNKRIIGFFLIFLLAGVGAVYWFVPQTVNNDSLVLNSSVYINLDNINLVQGEAGRKNWELTAERSKYFKDRKQIKVYQPKVKFYLKDSKDVLNMKAPVGIASPEKSKVELQNGVDANYAGSKLFAESMYYRDKEQKIEFRGKVSLNTKDFWVKSESACLDLDKNRLSFKHGVQVYLRDNL